MNVYSDPKPEPRVVDPGATKRALLKFPWCAACGRPASNGHHVLPVGRRGDDLVSNIVGLCGTGTSGCHGALHGSPYVVVDTATVPVETADGKKLWYQIEEREERRDREWVARRIGAHLRELRPDVFTYLRRKLGRTFALEFLARDYYYDQEAP